MVTKANKSTAVITGDIFEVVDNDRRLVIFRAKRKPRLWGWRCFTCNAGNFPADPAGLSGMNSRDIAIDHAVAHECVIVAEPVAARFQEDSDPPF